MHLPAHLSAVIFASLLLAACSDDEVTEIDVGPTGPPSIAFKQAQLTVLDESTTEACVSLGTNTSVPVPLLVAIEELYLRPPGTCGLYAQCGHLQLLADGVLNNESATTTIDLLVHKLASPYHDGLIHPGSSQVDVLQVEVRVVDDEGVGLRVDDNGRLLVDGGEANGQLLSDQLSLQTVVSCDDLDSPDG